MNDGVSLDDERHDDYKNKKSIGRDSDAFFCGAR